MSPAALRVQAVPSVPGSPGAQRGLMTDSLGGGAGAGRGLAAGRGQREEGLILLVLV